MTPCDKHCHKSKGAAEAHLRGLDRLPERRLGDERQHPYFCPWCRAWHVGRSKASAHQNRYR